MNEYKRLLEEIKDAFFIVQDENFAFVSSGLSTLNQYDEGELVGQPFTIVLAPEIRDQVLQMNRKRMAGEAAPQRYETIAFSKNGAKRPVDVTTWMTMFRGKPAVAGIVTDISKDNHRATYINAREEERRRLARELHDDTIQQLVVISHRLQRLTPGISGQLPENFDSRVSELIGLANQAIIDVRRFIQDLRPAVLDDMGLVPTLNWLTDKLGKENGVATEIHISGKANRLPPDMELTIFRIVQEGLKNIYKHAGASLAEVSLEFDEHKVSISIIDNGKGFNVPSILTDFLEDGKLGLVGIFDRVRGLNGSLKIDSSSEKGTRVTIEIPC
jgi:PAS domain S-box-containing protein